MHDEIHQNDIGTKFTVFLVDENQTPPEVDLEGATILEIRFKKPGGAVVVQTASIPSASGTVDGEIEYITVDGDLDEVGMWKIRGRVVLPTGTWTSSEDTFKVNAIF
ncbi:hypothetical protein LCGC14_0678690 [marine sediment metagenome]|uniref:YtkA-like domain-containing protein n=1 Tax=marine sediment metagenome TaxID=412755 RepID=A0A0F9QTY7_9ZZZZ